MSRTQINASLINPINNTYLGLGHNRVINGDMLIDQRNEGALISLPPTGGKYCADRWSAFSNNTGTFTSQVIGTTPPTGFSKYLHFACTVADATGGEYRLDHNIEGYNVRDFGLGTVNAVTFTLSFWVRSNQTGLWGGSFYNAASSRAYIFSYTINNANTWEYKTITVAGDITGTWATDQTVGIDIRFALGLGSSLQGTPGSWITTPAYKYGPTGMNNFMSSTSNTFDITGVQLEIGSAATAFEFMPIDIQLSRCQRYYEKTYPLGTQPGTVSQAVLLTATQINTSTTQGYMVYKVTKRVAPSITIYTQSGTSGQLIWVNTSGTTTQRAASVLNTVAYGFYLRNTAALEYCAELHYTADADY